MSSSSTAPTPEGTGSVWGAPHLPAGFTDTFTSGHPGCGHWVAEQAPDQLLAALTTFLAPTGTGRGHKVPQRRPLLRAR
jgi:hypothetical protein